MSRHDRSRRDPRRTDALLGVAAVVAVAIVGYVSYTALSGLPFERRYHVAVRVPSADRLIDTDEVRIAGVRVGQVAAVTAEPQDGGRPPVARLDLRLDRSVGRLPVDTVVRVRPASVLGATYVDLRPGTSRRLVPDGGALPAATPERAVHLPDLFDVFDRGARRSFRRGMRGLSGGLAGRGRSINATIGAAGRLMAPLERAMASAGSPRARLEPFVESFATFSRALAPASGALAGLVTGGARTMGALEREQAALAATLDVAPAAETAVTRAFVRARPALDALSRIAAALEPASRLLEPALDRGNAALAAGAGALDELPGLTVPLRGTLATVRTVSRRPSTSGALRKVRALLEHSNAFMDELNPAQTQCNVVPLGTQGFASFIGGVGVGDGPSFWNLAISTTGAQTDGIQAAERAPDLKVNYLPNNDAGECESGNEPGGRQGMADNPPGLQSDRTRPTTPPPGTRERAVAAGLIDEGGQ